MQVIILILNVTTAGYIDKIKEELLLWKQGYMEFIDYHFFLLLLKSNYASFFQNDGLNLNLYCK